MSFTSHNPALVNNPAIQALIDEAVQLVRATNDPQEAAQVHAALWPYVQAASGSQPAPTPRADRRARQWQYHARFWAHIDADPLLAGETAPTVTTGTGNLPEIIRALACELHGRDPGDLPAELGLESLRGRLPQLRNNLGRADSSALRVSYALVDGQGAETQYLAQVDVYRLHP